MASETIPEHEHPRPYATFVLDGEYHETVGGQTSILPRGSVLLHPEGERHADRFAEHHATLINVELPQRFARGAEFCRSEALGDPEMQMIGSRIRRELHLGDDLSAIVIEGIMLELYGLMMRRRAAGEPSRASIARLADLLIGARFAEPIGLSDLAAELEVDPAHLSRSFRKEIGCTVGERIRHRRVARACEIIDSGASLAEAALATGFADQSHLTRTFRAIAGVTPGEYRRRTG
jgi:AraC family transcriptional regulator